MSELVPVDAHANHEFQQHHKVHVKPGRKPRTPHVTIEDAVEEDADALAIEELVIQELANFEPAIQELKTLVDVNLAFQEDKMQVKWVYSQTSNSKMSKKALHEFQRDALAIHYSTDE